MVAVGAAVHAIPSSIQNADEILTSTGGDEVPATAPRDHVVTATASDPIAPRSTHHRRQCMGTNDSVVAATTA